MRVRYDSSEKGMILYLAACSVVASVQHSSVALLSQMGELGLQSREQPNETTQPYKASRNTLDMHYVQYTAYSDL